MNTILFGNGLNMLSNNDSWDQLVKRIETEPSESKIPNTIQFDVKLYSMDDFTINSEKELKKAICKEMKNYQSNEIYDIIAELRLEHYITTNYDFTIQPALMKAGFDVKEGYHKETTYSINRYVEYEDDNTKNKRVWYIHGELNRPNSIMLGYKHYCDYTGKIIEHISNSCWNEQTDLEFTTVLSWIDLFFCSNVYIMGLGLYYEEIDLWWLLSYRKRLRKLKPNVCQNNIVYFGECESGKRDLLKSLDVNVVSSSKNEYIDRYRDYIDIISKRI